MCIEIKFEESIRIDCFIAEFFERLLAAHQLCSSAWVSSAFSYSRRSYSRQRQLSQPIWEQRPHSSWDQVRFLGWKTARRMWREDRATLGSRSSRRLRSWVLDLDTLGRKCRIELMRLSRRSGEAVDGSEARSWSACVMCLWEIVRLRRA